MWWSRPVPALVVLALLGLGPAGCAFHPLYGRNEDPKKPAVADKMASIRIVMIQDRAGQKLRNELMSRLNPHGEPAAPEYELTVKLYESVGGLASSLDGTATLAELDASATYYLTLPGGGAYAGWALATTATDFLGARYASVASERDAEDRALAEIADKITSQIAIYLNNPASRAPARAGMQPKLLPTTLHYQPLQGLPPVAAPEPSPEPGQSPSGTAPQ